MDKRVTSERIRRRKYDEAFKRELVERSLQPGASVAAIAQDNAINANLLFNWRRLYLSSVNRLFLMGSSLSKSHLPRNYWTEETEQVTETMYCQRYAFESVSGRRIGCSPAASMPTTFRR